MNRIMSNKTEVRRIVFETIATIGVCALVFIGITQTAYSAIINQTNTLPAASSLQTSSQPPSSSIPAGYVKADYQMQLGQYSKPATAQDISKEEAAEIGAQSLWQVFGLDLSGKTIEMTYNAVTSTQPRADWSGIVTINENHAYFFSVDAITGELRVTSQDKYWDKGVDTGMDKSLLTNHAKLDSLAKEIAEKYQLVPGKVASVEYYGQGFTSNPSGAKNADVAMRVKSANGQQAQLTFSRYNQEFLGVAYDCWIKEATLMEEQILKKQQETAATKILIDDQKMEGAQESRGFWLKVTEKSK